MSADCGLFGRPLNDNDDRFIVVATFAEPGRWLNGYRTAGVGRLSRVARFIYLTKTNILFNVHCSYTFFNVILNLSST